MRGVADIQQELAAACDRTRRDAKKLQSGHERRDQSQAVNRVHRRLQRIIHKYNLLFRTPAKGYKQFHVKGRPVP
jgi:hypothetical protein